MRYSHIYVPYGAVRRGFLRGDDRVVPVIPNITKGWHDRNIWENFDELAAASAQKGIAVGNLGWIEAFANAGVNVFGDYGLNLYNSADFLPQALLGLAKRTAASEASRRPLCRFRP